MKSRIMELAKRAKEIIEETEIFISGIEKGEPSKVKVHIKDGGKVLALEGIFTEEEKLCFDGIDLDKPVDYKLVNITVYYLSYIEFYKEKELEDDYEEHEVEPYEISADNWCDDRVIGDVYHEDYVKEYYDSMRIKKKVIEAYDELMEIQKEAREILS